MLSIRHTRALRMFGSHGRVLFSNDPVSIDRRLAPGGTGGAFFPHPDKPIANVINNKNKAARFTGSNLFMAGLFMVYIRIGDVPGAVLIS